MTFTLRVPNSENPHLRSEAAVVSSYASLGPARRAFFRHQIAAERQGHPSEAFIWDDEHDCVVPVLDVERHVNDY